MIDIQGRNSTFKWVCVFLFILVVLFYLRSCEVRPFGDNFASRLFLETYDDAPLLAQWPWGIHNQVDTVRVVRDLGYLLAYEAFGYQYFDVVYRIIYMMVHLALSVCILSFMKRLTGNTLIGISSAVLFAGSYINSEAVIRNWCLHDQTVCLFGLLTLIFYIRHFDGKGLYNYLFSLLSLCMALLSKETGAMLPLLIFLVDIYLKKEVVEKGGSWWNGLSMRGIKMCLPFLLLSVLYMLLTVLCLDTQNVGQAGIGESFSLATLKRFLFVYRDFLSICLYPTPYASPGMKVIIAMAIVAVYVISDKGVRRPLLFLALCCLILMFPHGILAASIGAWRYVYFASVFFIGLFACVMNQGVEKLCGVRPFLSTVQPFFIETSKRRLLAAMLACWLFIYLDLVRYTLHVYMLLYGHIHGSFQPTAEYSATYYLVLLITSLVLLGVAVTYVRAGKGVKDIVHLAVFCTFILMIPTFVPIFSGRLAYFTAALPIALLTCAAGYLADRLLTPRIVDFKKPHAVCVLLLILIHSVILIKNYDYTQAEINGLLNSQKVRSWLAKPVREFILQKEGYRGKDVYLLNFPYVSRKLTQFGYEFAVGNVSPKKVAAYSCGLSLNAFDDVNIEALSGKIVQNNIDLGTVGPYDEQFPEISAQEFNELAKDTSNKMLLLDNVTEQILDVSGMDFSHVRGLIADKEKQKAFILP